MPLFVLDLSACITPMSDWSFAVVGFKAEVGLSWVGVGASAASAHYNVEAVEGNVLWHNCKYFFF